MLDTFTWKHSGVYRLCCKSIGVVDKNMETAISLCRDYLVLCSVSIGVMETNIEPDICYGTHRGYLGL